MHETHAPRPATGVHPIVADLAATRRAAGIHQQHIATGLHLSPKAGHKMVSDWEHGRSAPTVGHATGYAHLVGRRIIVTRDGRELGELLDVLPALRGLLAEAGLSIGDVAAGLFVHRTSLGSVLRSAGPRTRLTTAVLVLGAVQCTLELAPAAVPAGLGAA